MCECEMTRGDYINRRALAGSQIVTLRATIPELEKLSRRTPPKTLVAERAKVAEAARQLVAAKARLASLEEEYAGWRRLEEMVLPGEGDG